MSMTACLAIVSDITGTDSDAVLAAVDAHRAAGMSAADAQRTAANDLLAEIEAERAEIMRIVRAQHEDLFIAPPPPAPKPEPYKTKFFEPETKAERAARVQSAAEDAAAQSAWLDDRARSMGYRDIDQLADRDFDAFMALADEWRETNPAEVLMSRKPSTLRRAIDAQAAFDAVDRKSVKVEDAQAYFDLSKAASDAVDELGAELAAQPDDGFVLQAVTGDGRMVMVNASTKKAGEWQLTRFDREGEPFNDSQYSTKKQAVREFIREADITTLRNMDGDIRMARGVPSRYALPEFGRAAKTVEALQNRYNRWKQVIETVGEQGGIVNEANDFYRAEERYWGKVASRIEDFGKDVDDFVKALTDDGIDMRSMQLYAYAKHAKERNAYLRTVRAPGAGGFDSWSGMSDADADAIIADAKAAGLDADFDKHHATLMGWTQGTRDLLLDEGLITDDQYLTLQAAYDNYVPLGGKPGEQVKSKPGTGKGFNIRGKETERARGRYSEADNIIEQIIQARVTALTRAGKNEVLRSFLQFVIENPDPTLWEVNAIETRPVMTVDDQGNQIIEEQRSVVKDDRTVGIKDGGKEVFVKINDEVLREQMKNLNAEEIGVVHGHMLAAQRMRCV